MNWDRGQLAALAAVVEHQTFDAAARALTITPSAVSQRIRALEAQLGQVAVTRSRPCRPTTAGAELVRLARELDLLEAEADRRLGVGSGQVDLAVVVNADSLATWFRAVLGVVADVDEVTLAALPRRPGVLLGPAAIGRSAGRGDLRSGPDPGLHRPSTRRHALPAGGRSADFSSGTTVTGRATVASLDWNGLPMIRFDAKDQLQDDLLALVAPDARPPVHWVPSSADCAAAVRLGLGWAMLPEAQLGPSLDDGALVRLAGSRHADVRLFWQRWRVGSESLDQLTDLVLRTARRELRAG